MFCIGIAQGKIYYLEAFAEISEKGNVVINYTLMPENTTQVKIYIENPGEFLLPEECEKTDLNTIKCNFSVDKIKFTETSHVKSYKEKFGFEKNIMVFDSVRRSVFLVKLPEGALLPQNGTKFFPLYGKIGTDGRRIFVVWERKDIEKGEIQGMKIFYEFPEKKEKTEFPWFFVIIGFVIVAFTIIFSVRYLISKRRKEIKEMILPVLKDDEKKVMEIVFNYPKGVNQKKIVQESNYSKAKISKVLKSLSERGLVKLERRGRTNIVYPIFDFEKSER